MDLLWANTGLTGHVKYLTLPLINPLVKAPHWPGRGIVGNLIDMCKYIIFSVKSLLNLVKFPLFFSNLRGSKHHPLATWNNVSYLQLTNSRISLPFVKGLVFGDFVTLATLYLDKKSLLLHSIFKQKHSTMCSCLSLYEFESHACHMPSKYHLIGGSKTKYISYCTP